MRHFMAVIFCFAVVATVVCLTGCGNDEEATTVKTMEEYRTEAAQEINESNADAELEKITKEIEADSN